MKSFTQVIKGFGLALAALCATATVTNAQSITPPATPTTQTPSPPQQPAADKAQPRRASRRISQAAKVTVMPSEAAVAPQVVTIIHRLSGIQMLRLLLRQGGERGTVAAMDRQALTNNAHATIIAGWILPDGRTIAARLPQAAAELETADFPFPPEALKGDPLKNNSQKPDAAEVAARAAVAASRIQPDVTVITRDGRRLRARYVGLDGETGLSILQVDGSNSQTSDEQPSKLTEGQQVELFAPEPTTPSGEAAPGVTYVRVAKTEGKVAKVTRTKAGALDRLIVRAPKLSSDLVGGVVCDKAGNSVGIVERIEGNDAQVITADSVRLASRRVLDRRTNVPRPLLGIRGEPVEFSSHADFLVHGWTEDQLKDFVNKQVGILLTSVLPGTPAAFAKLLPGDVIVSVNDDEVKTAEEFTGLLTKCGPGEQVKLLVKRPTSPTPISIKVELGGSYEPLFEYRFQMPKIPAPRTSFQTLGLETMALSRKSASQFGLQGGLVVVSVKPKSAAAKAGLKEGDVIESIDGRTLREGVMPKLLVLDLQKKHAVSVIRDREKKQVILEPVE